MILAAFEPRYTTIHYLIYATMGLYLLAFLVAMASVIRKVRAGGKWIEGPSDDQARPAGTLWLAAQIVFAAGFVMASAMYIYRAIDVENVPLQDMFEVFLSLMVLIWPISMLCKRYLHIGGQPADMLIAVALGIFPGFLRDGGMRPMIPVMQNNLFVPHVATYMLGTVIMVKACIQGALVLLYSGTRPKEELLLWEKASYRLTAIAFPPMTVGLLLGCIWGKYAWGDFWGWDPKEQWSLATWMGFIAYLHMRYMFGRKHLKLNAACVIICLALIVFTLIAVNLASAFKGIHSYA